MGLRLDRGVQTAIRTQVVPSPTFARLATAFDKALQHSDIPEIEHMDIVTYVRDC